MTPNAGTQFARLKACIGNPFTDPKNGTYSLIFDGFNPYNRVTHSCFVVGITCRDLPPDAAVRNNNVRILAIAPGPEAPNNIHVCLFPVLKMMAEAAGGLDGTANLAPLRVRGALADGGLTDAINHVPYLTDIKADRMAQIHITGVKGPAACLSCHYCMFEGAQGGGGTGEVGWGGSRLRWHAHASDPSLTHLITPPHTHRHTVCQCRPRLHLPAERLRGRRAADAQLWRHANVLQRPAAAPRPRQVSCWGQLHGGVQSSAL